MEGIELFGFAAGVVTSSGMLPQLVKTIKTKKASEISILMFIVYLVGFIMWISYGVIREDIPIVATNLLSLLLTGVMIFLKIKYRNNS